MPPLWRRGCRNAKRLLLSDRILQICNLEKQQVVGAEAQAAHQGHRDGAAQKWPRPCSGLYSEKTGKTYDATVVLEDDGQYANFKLEFDQQKGGKR